MKKILVTGGCGYVGSWLVPQLLAAGHDVVVVDLMWFGRGFLPVGNDRLSVVQGDIRDIPLMEKLFSDREIVLHLACVSNDHSCQLDEGLSTSINFDAFDPLVRAAKRAGVRRFVYCSSSSVYGISDAPDVREDHELVPLTLYNRYKAACEPILLAHRTEGFETVILRPATVCGYAPRMRFDLTVNILTAHGVLNREITVFGGKQRRPNLHIKDMTAAYLAVLDAPAHLVDGETFNVGQQNMAVEDIATLAQSVIQTCLGFKPTIRQESSTDTRSYHVNSDKIAQVLGFTPQHSVDAAMSEICAHFASGAWQDALTNPIYTNMKQLVEAGHAVADSLGSYRTDRYPAK